MNPKGYLISCFSLILAGQPTAAPLDRKRWKLKSDIPVDLELMAMLHKGLTGDDRIAAHEFFLALAACNTVIPMLTTSTEGGLDDDDIAIDYQGESPDEISLVVAASSYGYTLFERTSGHIVIDVNGETLR